jgi:hypothetical protein
MMIHLEFSEFEMQYGNGVAESLDAAGIDGSMHAGMHPSRGADEGMANAPAIQCDRAGVAGKLCIAGIGGAVRDSSPEALT